jgi:hypothetical protein
VPLQTLRLSGSAMPTLASPLHPDLLDCAEIGKLKIVRGAGSGKKKAAFKVQLPGKRGHAIAKRCIQRACVAKRLLEHEASLVHGLHTHYGQQGPTGALHGSCLLPYPKGSNISELSTNFSVGSTIVVEMGYPLFKERSEATASISFRQCFAHYFSEKDMNDFRWIAYAYASYTTPLLLGAIGQRSDNVHLQQYARTSAGRIHHIDLDMVVPCGWCSTDYALSVNCGIIAQARDRAHNISTCPWRRWGWTVGCARHGTSARTERNTTCMVYGRCAQLAAV